MLAYVNKYMDFYAVVYNAISETTQNYNYHNWKWNISIIIFVVKQCENVRKLTRQTILTHEKKKKECILYTCCMNMIMYIVYCIVYRPWGKGHPVR